MDRFNGLYDGLLRQIDERGGKNAALTVGIPNVGKSSVLQALLRRARTRGLVPKQVKAKVFSGPARSHEKKGKTGSARRLRKAGMPGIVDAPGKTREITEYLLRDKPRAYFIDVPGITPPKAFFEERPTAWLGCGAANLLPLGRDATFDLPMYRSFCAYVLACANRDRVFHYVDRLGLSGPTDDVDEVLATLVNSVRFKHLDDEKRGLKRCANFLKLYNTGNLGPLVLDDTQDKSWRPFVFRDEHFKRHWREDWRARDEPGHDNPFSRRMDNKGHFGLKQPGNENYSQRPNRDHLIRAKPRNHDPGNENYSQRPNRGGDRIRSKRRNHDRFSDPDEWFRTP